MFSGLLNGALQNGVITYFANCNRGMTGFLMSFPNSVGYISLSYATDASITYAKVENKAGYFVLPNISTIQESIDFYLNTTTSLVFPLIGSPAPMSYPISLFTYFIFHSDNVDNCYSMAEFVSYIRWIYNNEDAVKMCSTSGFVPLSERLIRDVETKIIKDLTCGGQTVGGPESCKPRGIRNIIKISICDSHRLSMLTCVCFTIDFYSMAEK